MHCNKNVLLERATWKAKLSDFRSARLASVASTLGEGCFLYAAPEICPPLSFVTSSKDSYSFGVLTCEVTHTHTCDIIFSMRPGLSSARGRATPLFFVVRRVKVGWTMEAGSDQSKQKAASVGYATVPRERPDDLTATGYSDDIEKEDSIDGYQVHRTYSTGVRACTVHVVYVRVNLCVPYLLNAGV